MTESLKLELRKVSLDAALKRSLEGVILRGSETLGRGRGSLRTVVRNGVARFYYRHQTLVGKQDDYPLGVYEPDSRNVDPRTGKLSISDAREVARDAVRDNEAGQREGFSGVREYRDHLAKAQADERREQYESIKAEEKRLELANKYTLKALLDLYLTVKEEQGVAAIKDAKNLFTNYVYGSPIADKPANLVARKEVASLIRDAKANTSRQWQKLRSYIKAAYNLALDAEDDETADSRFIPFQITNVPVSTPKLAGSLSTASRERVLVEDELRALLRVLRSDSSYKSDLMKFTLLTGQRMEQFLRCKLKDLDLKAKIMTLYDKKGRRNEPKRHYVYLEGEALEIVSKFALYSDEIGSEYVFCVSPDRYIAQDTLSRFGTSISRRLLSESHISESFQARDLRRTVATEMSRLVISDDVKKRLLSHGASGIHDKHYNRYTYEEELRSACIRWEAELNRIELNQADEQKVINLRRPNG